MTEVKDLSALDRLGQQFEQLEREEVAPGRGRLRITLVLLAIAVTACALALTPPGRAVAERLGEIVGIGDEPTDLPDDVGRDSVVIGVGEGPSGTAYEVFATTILAPPMFEARMTCLGLNIPDAPRQMYGGACLSADTKRMLQRYSVAPAISPGPPKFGLDSHYVIQGLAADGVAAVEIDYGTEATPASVSMFELDAALSEAIGSSDVGNFFVGMVPQSAISAGGGPATWAETQDAFEQMRIRALGDDGRVLLDERFADLPLPAWHSISYGPPEGFHATPVPTPAELREPKPAN